MLEKPFLVLGLCPSTMAPLWIGAAHVRNPV